MPMGQELQEDNPGAFAKNPALQYVQAMLPDRDAALPTGHAVQVLAPPPLNVPLGQGVQAEAPTFAYVPGKQRLHTAAPVRDALKEPGAQGAQVALVFAPAAVPPALPTGQGVQDVAPSASPKVPGEQRVQLLSFAPPGRARKVPMGQKSSHRVEPAFGARSPGPQRMQALRPGTLV